MAPVPDHPPPSPDPSPDPSPSPAPSAASSAAPAAGRSAPDGGPLLTMTGITKSFPGVRALDGVDLDVLPGEVHCLLGQNGAGKSTLIKVLSGAHRPDAGRSAGAANTSTSPRPPPP